MSRPPSSKPSTIEVSEFPLREALVDLSAIRHNTRLVRDLSGAGILIGVVKANAYGHGLVEASRAVLEGGADLLGVTEIEEAASLREAGITAPILAWQHSSATDFGIALDLGLELGVGSIAQLERVIDAARSRSAVAVVHIKAETGLARNGVAAGDWDTAMRIAAEAVSDGALHVRGIWSHLANVSACEDDAAGERLRLALAVAARHSIVPDYAHLAASAAALTRPSLRFGAVRVGVALYGLQPEPYVDMRQLGFRAAMTVRARITAVRSVDAGTGVSYGHHGRTTRPTRLGLVPFGYADGLPRSASSRASFTMDGKLCPIVGNVAMDQCVVDLGERDASTRDAGEGDVAVLFGDPADGWQSADEVAAAAGTIGYELVTRIGPRVPRRYL
jgi:alanine racemase